MPYEYPANPEYTANLEYTVSPEHLVNTEVRHPDHQQTLNLHALSCKPRCMTMKLPRHLSLRSPHSLSFRLSAEPVGGGIRKCHHPLSVEARLLRCPFVTVFGLLPSLGLSSLGHLPRGAWDSSLLLTASLATKKSPSLPAPWTVSVSAPTLPLEGS